MELSNNYEKLQILTAKTWDLHVRMNEKIREKGFSLCNHCSNHGRNCVVSNTCMEENEKMIAITDSLQQLHNILLYLQRVRSRQEIERNEALGRLKESREILIERVNEFSEKERKFDVVDEVIEFIGDECPWHFKWMIDAEKSDQHKNTRLQVEAAGVPYDCFCQLGCFQTSTMLQQFKYRASFGTQLLCPPDCTRYRGTFDVLHKVIQQEGFSRLWRGTNASLALAVPSVGIYMPLYDIFRNYLEDVMLHNAPNITPYVPLLDP